MTKYFISKIQEYDIVGFDIDGTVYDEFDFIKQAYVGVAKVIAEYIKVDEKEVFNELCNQWKQFGSSKTTLFQDVFSLFSNEKAEPEFIKLCVEAFRNQPIELKLSDTAKEVFDYLLENNIDRYIVTDGNSYLQRKKINALELNRWFNESQIAISGDYGKEYQKPSPYMAKQVLNINSNVRNLYFGDRDVDMNFAKNINSDFIRIKNWSVCN